MGGDEGGGVLGPAGGGGGVTGPAGVAESWRNVSLPLDPPHSKFSSALGLSSRKLRSFLAHSNTAARAEVLFLTRILSFSGLQQFRAATSKLISVSTLKSGAVATMLPSGAQASRMVWVCACATFWSRRAKAESRNIFFMFAAGKKAPQSTADLSKELKGFDFVCVKYVRAKKYVYFMDY